MHCKSELFYIKYIDDTIWTVCDIASFLFCIPLGII